MSKQWHNGTLCEYKLLSLGILEVPPLSSIARMPADKDHDGRGDFNFNGFAIFSLSLIRFC